MTPLKVAHLQHYREAFNQKDATKNGKQQFLSYENSKHAYYAANGQTPRIAHKDASRETIKPEKAHQRTDKSPHKDHQFPNIGNVRYVEITCINHITREVGKQT